MPELGKNKELKRKADLARRVESVMSALDRLAMSAKVKPDESTQIKEAVTDRLASMSVAWESQKPKDKRNPFKFTG